MTNTDAVDGDEVVQLYLQYPRTRPNRPERQLRGFRRVFVPAGQTVRVEIPVSVQDLKFWSEGDHAWTLAPWRYRFLAGASSADILCRKACRLR